MVLTAQEINAPNTGTVNARSRVPRGSGRQTQPRPWNPYAAGGLGLIPRRGVEDPAQLMTRQAIERLAMGSPLSLLEYLPDVHPGIGFATWTALRMVADESVRIVAVKDPLTATGGSARPGKDETDDAGTAMIADLFESLPPEIGGFLGLLATLTLTTLFSGMCAMEAVIAESGKGVQYLWPVNPLTVRFGRNPDNPGGPVLAYQRQIVQTAAAGWTQLRPQTFLWRCIDNFPDDPYGRAPFAPALGEVLSDIAMLQDIKDAVRHNAWPRLDFAFDYKTQYEIAVEVLGITDRDEAAAWVQARFQEMVSYAETLKADDTIVRDANGKVSQIQGGSFQGVNPILLFLRQRVGQAVKTLPTLMGINDGSTQTYTTVEWAIQARGYQTLRQVALHPIVQAINLHFRQIGKPLFAAIDAESIRTTDALIEANTQAVAIESAITMRDEGWITQDQASMEITGSGAVADPPAAAAPANPMENPPTPPTPQAPGTRRGSAPPAGASTEDRTAVRGATRQTGEPLQQDDVTRSLEIALNVQEYTQRRRTARLAARYAPQPAEAA